NICTREVCAPSTGECQSVPAFPAPEGCEEDGAICRTAGFWGTHAGATKPRSVNITQAVINAVGPLSICGETIDVTIVNDDASALEALCVPVKGDQRLQLARQLTAAALNCVVSDGDADCSETALYAAIFAECNMACADSGASTMALASCISRVDCLNNGGVVLGNGFCQTGSCGGELEAPCNKETPCGGELACVPLDGTCHEQPLVNADLGLDYSTPGPAGSAKLCKGANKSKCVVVGSGQLDCSF
ncbi:MAG TPA: hypothetical protein VFP98_06120, partial [Candidatus Polarisedimenticolia bacterium]|nr:hypothetical protein [Candidatus Polarisedimenticolia bacterium]